MLRVLCVVMCVLVTGRRKRVESRCLGEEGEETGSGSREEAELDGESTSGALGVLEGRRGQQHRGCEGYKVMLTLYPSPVRGQFSGINAS